MLSKALRLPLIVVLIGAGAMAMFLPAVVAAAMREWEAARAFFHSGAIFAVLTVMLGLATANRFGTRPVRAPLIDLLTAFAVLPVMLAVPLWEIVPGLSFGGAYFEMVSSLTTTGATLLYDVPVLDVVHLWRALVGWLGGFLIWVMAISILAPMSLGGFEVMGRTPEIYSASSRQIKKTADTTARLLHYTSILAPVYAGLTLVLWIGLYLSGDGALIALCHAMSTLATSGITPLSSTEGTVSSFGGELLIALFLVFALSRQTFTRDGLVSGFERFRYDHELRVGFTLAVTVPLLLFLRHWVGAISDAGDTPIFEGLQALWGGFFTVLSFLTTTGFISTSWPVAQEWSGIATPGLIFVGLALTGGGVATTAGGIKLLRVHVLYRYSQGEVERLIHPNAVGRKPRDAQVNWRQGAFIAWVFFMLFAISIALVMLALALTGLEFEASLVLAVSALSTTGPLAQIVSDNGAVYSTLSSSAQTILALSMILGRLETLAIISLLNPEFWRK